MGHGQEGKVCESEAGNRPGGQGRPESCLGVCLGMMWVDHIIRETFR